MDALYTMAELDTIEVYNPLPEAFSVRFNGQMYTIEAKASKHFPQFLAFHLAKHLSDKMLMPDLVKIKKSSTKENSFNPQNAQLMIYDNPQRRIYLYDVLKNKSLVESCIGQFPFKPFVGEIKEYDEYVEKKLKPKESKAKPKNEAPVPTA